MKLNQIIDETIPVLFPIPAAYTVFDQLDNAMGFPWLVALCGAVGIELFGLRASRLSTRMKSHNDSHKNKTEEKLYAAPTWQTYALSGAYLLITGAVIFSIKGISIESAIIFSFPVFSLSGGFFSGLQNDQGKREIERQASRGNSKTITRQKPQGKNEPDKRAKKPQAKRKQKSKGKVNVEELLVMWKNNPKLSNAEAARTFGMKRGEAIAQWKTKLVENGTIEIVDGAVVTKQ